MDSAPTPASRFKPGRKSTGPVMQTAAGLIPSSPASLPPQQSALHTCPVVQATSSDFDMGDDSLGFPIAQCPAADWQFRQQLFFVNEVHLTRRHLFWFAIHGRIFPDCQSHSARFPNKMNFAFSILNDLQMTIQNEVPGGRQGILFGCQ